MSNNTALQMIAFNVSDTGNKIVTSQPVSASGKNTRIDTQDREPIVTRVVNEGTDVEGTATATIMVNTNGTLATTVHHGTLPEGADFEVTTFEISADADFDKGEDRNITETIIVTTVRALEEPTSLNSTVGDEFPDA